MIRKLTNSKAVFLSLKSKLKLADADETQAVALAIMEKYFKLSLTEILSEKEVDDIDFNKIIERLNQNEPLQYVLGEADFFGRTFKVNPSVLIPRPETELLIREVLKIKQPSPIILDVGTGSGCIAITLSLEIPDSKIYAIDVSEAALNLAQQNANDLKAKVNFIHLDFLKHKLPINHVDILVSNPPYVQESEKKTMNENVLNYEPHVALFVSDNNPLIFYRKIAEAEKTILKSEGKILVEINEQFGEKTKRLFQDHGYKQVNIVKDIDGKDRIVIATN